MKQYKLDGRPRFPLGRISVSAKALEMLTFADALGGLRSHACGEWGLMSAEDWWENELSLAQGYQVTSIHLAANGKRFWVVTEADRTATTIKLPSEN
ncbi:MAG: type I restriction endonuclease subunit M [Pirellulales bacterium]